MRLQNEVRLKKSGFILFHKFSKKEKKYVKKPISLARFGGSDGIKG